MVLKEHPTDIEGDEDAAKPTRWIEPADGWLLVGCILSGTMILGPIGPIVLGIAFWKLYKSVKAGTNVRPWAATIIGTFCLVDGLINFSPWTFDTFAHNTVLGETFITGYGRFFDGAFYHRLQQRRTGWGGQHSEKMWQYLAVFILMPMRVVSAWAFMQMRTWGLHFMKISAWLYLFLWTGYTMAMSLDFQERMATFRVRRRGLVDVQPVLSVAGIRAAVSLHRGQEPLVSLTPHWLPTGWFQVGWSDDIPVGAVRPLRYFGRELVAFRGEDGTLHILDAHCRHLGGHLGYGGSVQGDCVVCPFHGWHWNQHGRNTFIPYQPDRPNGSRRIRVWPVREQFGVVYLWHDAEGGEPSWEPPNIFTDTAPHTAVLDYHPASPHGLVRYGALPLHPQVVLENAADPIHFRYVHGTKHHPVFLRRWEDESRWFSQIGFGSRWREMEPDSHDGDTLSILAAGVGLSYTSLSGSSNTLILLSTTPVDDGTSEMFQTVWLEKLPGDTPRRCSSRGSMPPLRNCRTTS